MRVLALVLLAIFLTVAQAQEMPAKKEIVNRDLEEFSRTYYPSLKVEYLKIWHSKQGFSFNYWNQNNHAYSCEAMYYGSSGEVFLVYCLDQVNSTWPPTVHYYAFFKQDDNLLDSKKDIFPINVIFEQLRGYRVNDKKVRSLLSKDKENPTLYHHIDFEKGEGDTLLVSVRPIKGVIEGAVYTSMIWDTKSKMFVLSD